MHVVRVVEAIIWIMSAMKVVGGKPPTERLFLDEYGKICVCLDAIVWKVRGSVSTVFAIFLFSS